MRSVSHLPILGFSTALAILATSCTGQDDDPEAFCDQLEESETRLQEVARDASAAGSDLAQLVIGLGSIGEYGQMLDDLVDVAPPEIESDMTRARDTFVSQSEGFLGDGSASGIAVAAISGLFGALANQTAFDNVDDFARANCGRTVFAFEPSGVAAAPSDDSGAAGTVGTPELAEDPTPTGAYIGEDLGGVAWYSSQVPAEPLADDELPFVKCNADSVDSSDALWAMDLDEMTTRPVLELTSACNMGGSLTDTQLTHDGRYVVSVWASESFGAVSRVVITDTATGAIHEQSTDDISARITELTSQGLDATSTSVDLIGFDASRGGWVYYSDGRSRYDTWAISIDDILDPSRPPPDTVEAILCHDTFRFNQSGTYCARQPRGSSTSARLVSTTEVPAPPDTTVWGEAGEMSTSSWTSMTYWLDDTTTVGSNGYAKTIWSFDMTQERLEEIVQIQGERSLSLWPTSRRAQVYFTSLTLDEQEVEIYEASLDGGEPVVVGTVPASYELVPLPS